MHLFMPEKKIFIQGPSIYLPDHELSNEELIKLTKSNINPAVVSFSTGIRSRHWASSKQACSDLAVEAAHSLFTLKSVQKEKIVQLILATISGDYLSPPTSPIIQHQLGLKNIGAFDLGAACAGFVVGLHTAVSLVQSMSGDVLLIASEIRSKFLNPEDFGTNVLFGDGAAACLISQDSDQADFQFIASTLYSDGEVGDLVSIPGGGSRCPASLCEDKTQFFITVKDNSALFVKAVEGMTSCASHFLQALDLHIKEIDWIVPHQGNKHLLTAVCSQLGIPEEKLINVITHTGNTSGASVGMALDGLRKNSKLKSGDKILLVAAGGGGIAGCSYLIAV
jgi:3-oxoacyl-[acyl-carrier-protein] synthase-3